MNDGGAMYEQPGSYRSMGRASEPSADLDPTAGLVLALQRVRKLLTAYLPGMRAEPSRFRQLLARPVTLSAVEAERRFALGWLSWLEGELLQAETEFTAAGELLERGDGGEGSLPGLLSLDPGELPGRTAYWLARTGLLLERSEAIARYEARMRRAGGPQATAWYVDLLFRAGRVDRVETVWKTVRANPRVAACDEATLLEARLSLRRGEPGTAERLLRDAQPRSGVAWTERWLWLAWALVELRRPEAAREVLAQAHQGPYPHRPLADWSAAVEARLGGAAAPLVATAPGWREFVQGQQARRDGNTDEARRLYQAALDVPAVAPFARYGLSGLGAGDPAAVLAAAPGVFFAGRARWRQLVERFRLRQVDAAAFLEARHGQRGAIADGATLHFCRLAELLRGWPLDDTELLRLVEQEPPGAARRNVLLAVLQRRADLPATAPDHLLPASVAAGAEWQQAVAGHLVRLGLERSDKTLLTQAAVVCPGDSHVAVANALLAPPTSRGRAANHPLLHLRDAALQLLEGEVDDQWRRSLADQSDPRCRPLAQLLLLADAARREDLAAVRALLEDRAAWLAGPGRAPPRFAVRLLEGLVLRHPGFAGWPAALPTWLELWPALTGDSLLAVYSRRPGAWQAAATVAAPAWLLHQAARAVLRQDVATALACLRHAAARDPSGTRTVAPVLPRLQRLVDAERLAGTLRLEMAPALLTDLVDRLDETPAAQPLLAALQQDDTVAAWMRLAELADAPDLPPRLAHHLALLEMRQAETVEETDPAAACAGWRRAWRHWLTWLAGDDPRAVPVRPLLLAHLLERHRHRIEDQLARGETAAATALWSLVGSLPEIAGGAPFAAEVADRVARFHDELTTEYLLTTREAMRHGVIPEGWRADYSRGLNLLERLLDLDPGNGRLLTALVETSNDWALDLYHGQQWQELAILVQRCLPAAERLWRSIDGRAGELLASNALSEFWKVRGFVEEDAARKAALYREALRLNPANGNARALLAELESRGDDDAG